MLQAESLTVIFAWANRAWAKIPTTVRAHIHQNRINAVFAKGALIGAYVSVLGGSC